MLPAEGGVPAVARLWAQRKIDFLLAEIRRNGEVAELKDEVVRLATRHHIVSPYTAGLVVEDEPVRPDETLDHDEPVVEDAVEYEEVDGEDGLSDAPFSGPSTNSAIISKSRWRAAPISGQKDGMPAALNALWRTLGYVGLSKIWPTG